MDYEEIEKASRAMGYRDKLRLAQLLIQLARRDEEQAHPLGGSGAASGSSDAAAYAAPLRKLRPSRRSALMNSLEAMFQFRGGISNEEKEEIVVELGREHGISVDTSGRVSYAE